jgi:dolichol-phosphate mannosyltransferase
MTQGNAVIAEVEHRPAEASQPPWRTVPSRVLVVLPAFNEEENLGTLLEQIDEALYAERLDYEVIVVDDGSKDGTLAVAQAHARHMPIRIERHLVNQGLGATMRDGLRAAVTMAGPNDVVVAMDADNTHKPGLIRAMLSVIREGYDVVIASRYQSGAVVRGVPFLRRVLSSAASLLFRLVFPITGVKDYTCGYRAYRASLLRAAFDKYGDQFVNQEGFQCTVDLLLKLSMMGAICRELPFVLRYDLKGGVSKMRVARTIRRTLGLMLRRRLGKWS